MILALFTVSATSYLSQHGNVNYHTSTMYSGIAYGSNTPGLMSNYTTCQLAGSVYEPKKITYESLSGYDQIVVFPTKSTIDVYDYDCNLIAEEILPAGEFIRSEPMVIDFNHNTYPEIAVLTNTSFILYERKYNDTSTFTNISIYNYSILNVTNLDFVLTNYPSYSFPDEIIAVFFKSNSKDIYTFEYNNGKPMWWNQTTQLTNMTSAKTGGYANGESDDYMTITGTYINSESVTDSNFYIPMCMQRYNVGSGIFNCDILKLTRDFSEYKHDNITIYTSWQYTPSANARNPIPESFIGKVNNQFRVMTRWRPQAGGSGEYTNTMHSITGTLYYESLTSTNYHSHWMISDIDMNGFNEAMYIIGVTPVTSNEQLYILDSAFDTTSTDEMFTIDTKDVTTGRQPYIAQVFPGNTTMAIMTTEGILSRVNSTSYYFGYNSTITTADITADFGIGTCQTYLSNGYCYHMYIFGNNGTSYLIRNYLSNISCGDGVCGIQENELTCAEDCIFRAITNRSCFDDTDCTVSPYLKCLNYECIAGYNSSQVCLANNNCPIGKFCYNGYCIQAVSGQPISESDTLSSGGGNDIISKSITTTSLIFLIGIAVLLIFMAMPFMFGIRHPVVYILFSFIGMLVDVKFKLLPPIFLIVFVIICIALGIWAFKSNSSVGG